MVEDYRELERAERELRAKGNKTPKSDANKEMEANQPESQPIKNRGAFRGYLSSRKMALAKLMESIYNSKVKRGEIDEKHTELTNWGDGQITIR